MVNNKIRLLIAWLRTSVWHCPVCRKEFRMFYDGTAFSGGHRVSCRYFGPLKKGRPPKR